MNQKIGIHLRELRKISGLSQYEVAHKCHVKQSHISKTELGEHALLFSEIFTYAPALGLKPDDLFDSICRLLNEYAKSKAQIDCQPNQNARDHASL
ncbi:MAG: helix-turn-helix transcriptional regulator [Atopobiaceae bacterium]|nr:helix-turn-helix transcriptional regulator [Atopobiaceae bacterium]